MGYSKSKSQTESGIKYIYQCFIFYFILRISILFVSLVLVLTRNNLYVFTNSTAYYLGFILVVSILILVLLIRGLADIFNGRKEFDETHESNVILGAILLMIYFIIFIINLAHSKGLIGGSTILSVISTGFSTSVIIPFIVTITASMISLAIFSLALTNFVKGVANIEQKERLKKALYLMLLGPVTLDITTLFSLVIFYRVYRDVYFFLNEGHLKAKINAPCPNCNNDISIESLQCPHCGIKFEKDANYEIDPRLSLEPPKDFAEVPKGYTPIEGPTYEEKRRVKNIIISIIATIIIIAVLYLVISTYIGSLSNESSDSKEAFLGAWSGGISNGTNFISQENWTFYANGSLLVVDSFGEHWYTFSIESSELCKKDPSISFTMCYDFEFTLENKKLILHLSDLQRYEFYKV
jgi:hypothetical protein